MSRTNMSAIEIMFLTEFVNSKDSICNRDDYESQKEQKLEKSIHKSNSYKQNAKKHFDYLNRMIVIYFNRIEENLPYYNETDMWLQ